MIIIPSRMGSSRLPNKPLADIAGLPMIVHVWQRANEAKIAPVYVACDDTRIAEAVTKAGGSAVLTRPEHPSGSDRIWEALHNIPHHEKFDAIINVQGDEPTLDAALIHAAYDLLKSPDVDIATLAAPITDEAKKLMPQVVKPAIDVATHATHGRALYFSRHAIPSGEGPIYHHIGLYAYRREALAKFVASPPAPIELREKLEQLRALALGLRIEVGIVNTVPRGVDTPEDLEEVRRILGR
jgi:3-deoxy-manno-octulosonate cytidylyltransferase (CMP-KDO synthetase)